jgi:hypothetical protein
MNRRLVAIPTRTATRPSRRTGRMMGLQPDKLLVSSMFAPHRDPPGYSPSHLVRAT